MIEGFVSKHVVASLRDANQLSLGETRLREATPIPPLATAVGSALYPFCESD